MSSADAESTSIRLIPELDHHERPSTNRVASSQYSGDAPRTDASRRLTFSGSFVAVCAGVDRASPSRAGYQATPATATAKIEATRAEPPATDFLRRLITALSEGLGRDAPDLRILILQQSHERGDRLGATDLGQGLRDRSTHIGVGVAQRALQRGDRGFILEASERMRDVLSLVRVGIGEQGDELRRRLVEVGDVVNRVRRLAPDIRVSITQRREQRVEGASVLEIAQTIHRRRAHFRIAIAAQRDEYVERLR